MKGNEDRIFTIPNILDFYRILAAPIIMWSIINKLNRLTFILLGTAFLTDLLDGFIARTFHQISKLGKTLDPVADKFLFGFVVLGICFRDNLHFWSFFLGILISIYFIGFLWVYPIFLKKGLRVNLFGKACVFINSFILFFMVFYPRKWMLIVFTTLLVMPQIVYLFEVFIIKRKENSEK